jgi:hypothetical protein
MGSRSFLFCREPHASGFAIHRCNDDWPVPTRAAGAAIARIRGVTDQTEIDEALKLAVVRTREAQDHVSEELDRDKVPDDATVEIVVERADDLSSLARDAAGGAGPDPKRDGSSR